MQIDDIQDNFRLRTEISVILRTGQQFYGILAGINETSITLRQSTGGNIVLSAEAIDCIFPSNASEFHTDSTCAKDQSTSSSTTIVSSSPTQPTSLSSTSSATPSGTNSAYSLEVITQVVEIAARLKTATQQASLEPLPPDFSLPAPITSLSYGQRRIKMQTEWEKPRNQFDYAQKIRDLGRLDKAAQSYSQIIAQYPELSAAAYFNWGCFYLIKSDFREALKIFEMGVADSPEPKLFYNLAFVALKRKDLPKGCYALESFFKKVSPVENLQAWYKFLELILELGAINALIDLLEQSPCDFKDNDSRVILESVVFIIYIHGLKEDAYNFMAHLLDKNSSPHQTLVMLKAMFDILDIKPTESYLKQEEGLLDTARKLKETKLQQRRQSEVQALFNRATQREKQGQYSQAIAEIRKILQIDPENALAKEREAEYREAERERGLPTGSGPYAQAKRAHILDKDFKKSEKFYREAIKKGDNSENAVKDLASLYIQQNQDEKAIQLLQEHLSRVNNREPVLNQLATAYQRLGKYRKEIDCLQMVLSLTVYERRSTVLNRIASAQYNLGDYEQSEKTLNRLLRENPRDEVARARLEGLREAKHTKIYTKLDALFLAQEGVLEEKTSLSDFLAFHLERCDYFGVEAATKASRQFSEKDVNQLLWAADKGVGGTKRPSERASYYLSATKILMDLGAKAEELNPRVYLRNFCAAMGDACMAERKPKDVARSYYAEAFFIAPDWIPQLDVKLSQFIMLHYASPEDILKADLQLTVESCLEQALKITNLGTVVIENLFYLSWLNREVGRVLINKIHPNKRLRESVQSLCYQILGEAGEPANDQGEFLELWERGRDFIRRKNQEVVSDIAFLNSVSSGLDSLREQISRVQELGNKVRADLDKQRLRSISEILNSIYDYSQQQSYPEREYYATTIQSRVIELVEEIEANPTKYSCELFRSYLLSLGKTIETHFDEIQAAAEPEEIQVELSIDSYTPDSTLGIECQVTLTNKSGKSPVKAITIQIQSSPTDEYLAPRQKSIPVTESLQGGQSVTCQVPVVVTRAAMESQVFTLYQKVLFTTRRGRQLSTEVAHSVRLYPTTDFKQVGNPYESYAQGSTVESEDMFYGRDQDIARLASAIQNATSAKSLVIYGQKRAGKSSVLYHLKRKLKLPIVPVSFSIGDIIEEFSVATFLYRIIQCIEESFEDLADEGKPRILLERPQLKDLQNSQLVFQDYMASLQRILKRSSEYSNARIMLLIDEFSYIYGEIMRGRVQDTFMKSWKALLEKRYFGAVLVGQDTMPQFIQQFPNDFQVAESQRISYLAPADAERLIVDPIRIPETGESRYKGNAVKRLIELTSGSPYYIQIFCNRLVNYMNRKQAVYVTDADIERVKDELVSGHSSLEGAVFDNLTSAGDSSSESISKEDAEVVLRTIAIGSRNQGYCDRTAISLSTTAEVDQILDDLVRREVLEKQKSAYRIKVDLFKEWLLANQ